MGRYLFTFLAAVSFVVFLLSPELDIRARQRYLAVVDDYTARAQAISHVIDSEHKQLDDDLHRHPLPTSAEIAESNRQLQVMNRQLADIGKLSVAQRAAVKSEPFPYSDLMLPAMVLPLLWIVYASWLWDRTKTRIKKNQCIACGYDLRATPQRCPECGRENTKLTFARRIMGNLKLEM